MSDTVLVVAAHPDDEALGMGGTLARLAGEGARIHCLFLTDGEGARGAGRDLEAGARRRAAERAAEILGVAKLSFRDFPDNGLDGVALLDVVRAVEAEIESVAPSAVYTHYGGDLNVDHAIAQRAVLTACRPLPGRAVRAIYAFEVPSSTEWAPGAPFSPQRFVAIDVDRKLAALDAYEAELRASPHPRSARAVRALAEWRGASCGLAAAEAFEVIREIAP